MLVFICITRSQYAFIFMASSKHLKSHSYTLSTKLSLDDHGVETYVENRHGRFAVDMSSDSYEVAASVSVGTK